MEKAKYVVWKINNGVVSGVKCDACPLTIDKRPVGATGLIEYTEDTPTECAQRCNNRGQDCNYWSWSQVRLYQGTLMKIACLKLKKLP